MKENTPFPDKVIELGKLTVGTTDSDNIEFETDTVRVSFNGLKGDSSRRSLNSLIVSTYIVTKVYSLRKRDFLITYILLSQIYLSLP